MLKKFERQDTRKKNIAWLVMVADAELLGMVS
jgi:hypothetical protein